MNRLRLTATLLILTSALGAQESLVLNPAAPAIAAGLEETDTGATDASIFNDGEARTMTLSIPALRGLILDREGRPLAQSKMAYHLAVDFTKFDEMNAPDKAVAWAQDLIVQANVLTEGDQTYSNDKLKTYYEDRRWIPRKISQVFDEDKAKILAEKLPTGLVLLPVYQRFYPEKSLAAHLIGYVSARTILPSGPINDGDPLFQSVMGAAGFEMVFDSKLQGIPGLKKMIFDKKGRKVLDEIVQRPRPGCNIVTTIDLDWQRYAERVLREDSKRGAFVVIDIQTGEVLVMASRPTYDLNEFVPYITKERFEELNNDPSAPLYGRAFQAEYPPASTFKPVVTLAAISNGVIDYNEQIDSPYKIKIGSSTKRNYSGGDQGPINAQRALAKSVNTWFYRVGIKTGPQAFLSVARRLGYGSKTGLPLFGENPGWMPTAEEIEKKEGRPTTNGDTANMAIGQGSVTATPLQVAQSMAAIGNGNALMELQLIRQIQDFHGRVIEAPVFAKRNDLNLSAKAVSVTQNGMFDVVHAGYGTGKRGDLGFTLMCGKTGTAQWKPAIGQELAWFSGFFPKDNPRYAFAVVYEGVPGESLSGGRNAAPLIRRFFRHFREEIEENLKPAAKAKVVEEDDPEVEQGIPKAMVVKEEDEEEDIPMALPLDPVDNPGGIPSVPVEPGEPVPTVPEAFPVEPLAPADLPKPDPEVPADQ